MTSTTTQVSPTHSPTAPLHEPSMPRDIAKQRSSADTRYVNVGPTERIVSLASGAALLGLGLIRGRLGGVAMAGLGASLLYRGSTGHCQLYAALGTGKDEHPSATSIPSKQGYRIEKSITVNKPADELYAIWRDLERLPNLMSHLHNVEVLDEKRSHWTAQGPMGLKVSWTAEIITDRANEAIAWRSEEGSQIDTAGSVHFKQLPGKRGTAIRLNLKYNPPGGAWGANLAALLGTDLESQLTTDLARFKAQMETGEVPTIQGQTHGQRSLLKH